MQTTQAVLASPLGNLILTEADGALIRLAFTPDAPLLAPSTALLRRAVRELEEYFAGSRRAFTLPMNPQGTAFQRAVWQALTAIPYGETLSYARLAARIGHPGACRAVGSAVGRNPLPVLIPCHRVIPQTGGVGGYAGGADRKSCLLALEKGKK